MGRVVQAAEAKGDQRLRVLGTTFKACSNRPDVIEGNRELFGAKAAPPLVTAAPDDDIVLEDEAASSTESRCKDARDGPARLPV